MSRPYELDFESDRGRLRLRFGDIVDLYERARPGYAAAAIEWALAGSTAGAPHRVLDLAAGTGKLTAQLVEAGFDVVAIDPSEPMLAALTTNLPGVDARVASAESTGLPDADVDAVVIASALHWFERPAADHEIARVLRSGGVVAVFQNRRDTSVPWVADLNEVIQARSELRRQVATARRYPPFDPAYFGPPETTEVPFTQELNADGLAELYASRSYVIDMGDADRDALLSEIREFARVHPELAGRDSFEFPYLTVVDRSRRR